MSFVLDSSLALGWIHVEENTPAILDVYSSLRAGGYAWVPSLWRLEIANILELGVRRGRHDAAFRNRTLADLSRLSVRVDRLTDRHAWGETLLLAERHSFTLYDASYLELALRRALPLATLDRALRGAAATEKVVLLGL